MSTNKLNACRNAYDCLICKNINTITSTINVQLIETKRDFIFCKFGFVKKVSIKSELLILLIRTSMDLFLSVMKTLEMSRDSEYTAETKNLISARNTSNNSSSGSGGDEHTEYGNDNNNNNNRFSKAVMVDDKKLYGEFLHRTLKARSFISNNYISFLFFPVLMLFFTIAWNYGQLCLIFKSIITFLLISHTILVTNKLTVQ